MLWPTRPRAYLLIGVVIGLTAALLLARRPVRSREDLATLQDLARAMAAEPVRPVAGRLSGGFSYAAAPAQTRGSRRIEASPDVRIVAASIEKSTANGVDDGALGVAFMAVGEWGRAVAALEDATGRRPGTAGLQNNLSVAYLARALAEDRPEDWARALAAADRAIAADSRQPEPFFNRALAFGGLHMAVDEAAAWRRFQAVDAKGPWRDESNSRLEALDAHLRETSHRDSVFDHQAARERIEDELLGAWGAAFESGDASAERLLGEAADLANRLASDGGDTMARDEIQRILHRQAAGDRSGLRELAAGHQLYATARRTYLEDHQLDASKRMAEAAVHFRRASSEYAAWAPVFRALYLRNNDECDAALDALRQVTIDQLPPTYYNLRGRIAWTQSLAWDTLGRFDRGRDLMTRAIDAYQSASEGENLVATRSVLTEEEWFLGDRVRAWTNLAAVLEQLDRQGPSRRYLHFGLAATMSQAAGLAEAAVEFESARVRVAGTPRAEAEAYLRRAATLASLKRDAEALADLDAAGAAVSRLTDPALRERNAVDVEAARASVLSRGDCRQSLMHGEQALAHLNRPAESVRRSGVITIQAHCRMALGDVEGARRDLQGAMAAFEQRRDSIANVADRVQVFELERRALKALVSLEAVTAGDEAEGLRVAERGRSGAVAAAWRSRAADFDVMHPPAFPAGLAIVYYESLPDRVLVWVLTPQGRHFFSRAIGEQDLGARVAAIQRTIQNGADLPALRHSSGDLYEALIAPALAFADRDRPAGSRDVPTIFFVPDGPLFALPFAALPDADGRALVETRIVGTAPSLRTFVAASNELAGFRPGDVVSLGDGHDAATTGLPMLTFADDEAAAVGRVYPRSLVLTGAHATKERLLGARAAVVHFAGHTVLNERYPMLSRMLLAPSPGELGVLFGTEITAERFPSARVVVLATCEGAAGRPVEGEGALSMARAFFAAGVPAVVASLWPVADDLQPVMTTFHQELRRAGDPAHALRAAQLVLLARRGRATPVSVWGGFTVLGGFSGNSK
jgi:CHAT domain-containing protein